MRFTARMGKSRRPLARLWALAVDKSSVSSSPTVMEQTLDSRIAFQLGASLSSRSLLPERSVSPESSGGPYSDKPGYDVRGVELSSFSSRYISQTTMATINDLPIELIELMGSFLLIADILNFRWVAAKYANGCVRPLRDKHTRLYIHPARLEHVVDVCNHEKLCKKIHEIVIVGASQFGSGIPRCIVAMLWCLIIALGFRLISKRRTERFMNVRS